MPTFSYLGYSEEGLSEEGTIDAANEKMAFETLASRGVTVFELQQGAVTAASQIPWYRRDIKLFGEKLDPREQANTAQLMSTLASAELTAPDMVRLLAISSESQMIKLHFERVGQRLENGETLAEAFEAENKVFSPIFVSFLRISDTANTLPMLLEELATFFRKQADIQQKIMSALIYPAILLFAAIALLFVVVLYLAPNLEPIFSSVGKDPPVILTALLKTETFLRSNWFVLLFASAAALIGCLFTIQLPWGKNLISTIFYRLPLVGNAAKLASLSRITSATAMLLKSGQTVADALRNASNSLSLGGDLQRIFHAAASSIEQGSSASSVFADEASIPSSFAELFRIGEETNRLPSTLSALSETLSSQVERTTQRVLTLLTPALTLFLGLGIGLLIYTLMGAILEVNELAF